LLITVHDLERVGKAACGSSSSYVDRLVDRLLWFAGLGQGYQSASPSEAKLIVSRVWFEPSRFIT